jgi:hypothetical protein
LNQPLEGDGMGLIDFFFGKDKYAKRKISWEQLLSEYYYKKDIQKICKDFDINPHGYKEDLIRELVDNVRHIEDLLSYLKKEDLKQICQDLKDLDTGKKEDLIERIADHVGDLYGFYEYDDDDDDEDVEEDEMVIKKKHGKKDESEIKEKKSDSDRIKEILKKWSPDRTYKNESGYQGELYSFFKHKHKFKIRQEAGKSRADILVGDCVSVEIKKNPSSADYDRLYGQIMRQKREFGDVVVLVFDIKNEDAYEDFRNLTHDIDGLTIFSK